MYPLLFTAIAMLVSFATPAHAAPCDATGLTSCTQWAQEQVSALGCRAPSPTFENAVADLYSKKGCRLEGTRWYNIETGAAVKGSYSNGVNTDTAGCIARYTPGAYLRTGGYFRTPTEAINGPLRNKSLSGCEREDASSLTKPMRDKIESCSCADLSVKPTPPAPTSAPATPATSGGTDVNNPPPTPPTEEEATLQGSTELDPIVNTLPLELRDRFKKLAALYRERIPEGTYGREANQNSSAFNFISAGSINNIFGQDATACGAYQGTVLDFLDALRKSNNQEDKKLLEGFDFGPIQIAGGAHQAVAIFPKGTDWQTTGIVLDPWKDQKPKVYSIGATGDQKAWCRLFWLGLGCPPKGSVGNIVTPIDANTGRYPTTPNPDGTWRYPSDIPRHSSAPSANRKKISVGSPVTVLLTAANGKQLGIDAQGAFHNDFGSSVEAQMMSAPDGTYESTFNLPAGSYAFTATGTGSGDVHVWTASGAGTVQAFAPTRVTTGQTLALQWSGESVTLKDAQGKEVSYNGAKKSLFWPLVGAVVFVTLCVFGYVLYRRNSGATSVPPQESQL